MSRLFRCSICDTVSDDSLQNHNIVDKGHYYEDPKHKKESFLCDDCYIEYSVVALEFAMSDELEFNPSLKKVR